MAKTIAVILGHPSEKQDTLCYALAEAYFRGAEKAGHSVRFVEVSRMGFNYLTHRDDYEVPGVPEDIGKARGDLAASDHWVFVYPLWLGDMPAKLKAFLEWTLGPGFAYEYDEKGRPHKLLKGRSARVIVTMGMPALIYRLFFLSHSVKVLERNILKFIGIKPVRHSLYGGVEAVSDARRKKWLEQMESLGERAR